MPSAPTPPVPTIKQCFDTLTKRIWNPKYGPVSQAQREGTERAFYSGALAAFMVITGPITSLSDDDACAAMEKLDQELSDYFKLLEKYPNDTQQN